MSSTTPLSLAKVSSKPSTLVKGRLYFMPLNNKNPTKFYTFLAKGTSASSDWCPLGLQPIDVILGTSQYQDCYSFTASYSDTSGTYNNYFELSPVSFNTYSNCGGKETHIYSYNTTSGTPYTSMYTTSDWEEYKSEIRTESGATPSTTYAQMRYEQTWGQVYTNLRVGYNDGNSGMYNSITFEMFDDKYGSGALLSGGLYTDGNDVLIGDPDSYGVASLQVLVGLAQTCFRGDTSYITMADGSKKLIQDVKVGDVVKGYDVNKKDYTDAVVLQNVKTGEERAFDCYVMDDGTTVDIFNNDGFICYVGKRKMLPHRDADGDYINVYSMKTLFSFHERKDDQRRIIKEDGNLENTTCVIHKFQADCAHRTARYTLYTSNGTFFVNGLLHGLASRSLPQYFKTHKITTPDYIDKIFDGILLDLAQRDESLPDTHIENPDKVSDLATLNKAKATIAWAKNKLSETDYKARKYVEGEISEEEWAAIKEQAAEWRKTVNDNEAIVEEYTEKVKKDNPAMFDTTSEEPEHVVRHAQWLKHQKTYDDNYKLFKQWADERVSYKEEQREKARKEHEQKKAEYEARKAKILAEQNSNKEVK